MQSGELKQGDPEEASPPSNMTVGHDSTSPKPQLTPEDFTFANADDKLETQESEMHSTTTTRRERSSESRSSQNVLEDDEVKLLGTVCPNEEIFNKMREQNPNESVRNWLQRITQMQQEIQKKRVNCENATHAAILDFQKRPSTAAGNGQPTGTAPIQSAGSRIVKYQDLPYMGEMTLENSKPRRGRKPKKADICHLIYKNYGTIFPGTPKNLVAPEALKRPTGKQQQLVDCKDLTVDNPNRTDVQNKIISSLLERRLTQESRRNDLKLSEDRKLATSKSSADKTIKDDQDEPLNLCVRDLNQLKIRLLRKHGNVYTSEAAPDVKSEPQSDDDIEIVSEIPSPAFLSNLVDLKNAGSSPEELRLSFPDLVSKTPDGTAPGGYVYWPNAGVFIHPAALQQHLMYYQRLAANNNYTLPSTNSPKPASDSVDDLRSTGCKTPRSSTKSPSDAESVPAQHAPPEPRVKRNASTSSSSDKAPTKRKRSAIFIPPIPTENQTNPATEVSICKFKFTGGAKPSLQEKKMLSVDSGGNFRYYSGTGDKSMRGYEFFPRETLQQQAEHTQGSSTGAFLQASGEKIYPVPSPIDFTGKQCHPDFMMSPFSPLEPRLQNIPPGEAANQRHHRKRKTKKSLQREKLEQTFKEKGFLIQTQQLESAEGATYCKFRQLRKFTRYLFRSWKDYLPGSVREMQEGERSEGDGPPGEGVIEQIQVTPTLSPDSLA